LKSRKWKRNKEFVVKERLVSVPIPRNDRLSAIVPIDRICEEEGRDVGEGTEAFLALCESVRKNGILQPLLLRRVCDEKSSFGGIYLLVAGRRRLAAARKAGHKAVPCYIVTMDAKEAALTAVVTDMDRVSRNMFELSDAIEEMRVRFHMSIAEISIGIGKTEIYIAGKLLLQRYTCEERGYILRNRIPEDIALVLLQIRDPAARLAAMRQVCEKRMNRTVAADYVRSVLSRSVPSPKNSLSDLQFFYNSVDKLMDALRHSGANADLERREYAEETVVTIRVAHRDARRCVQEKNLSGQKI